MADLDYQFEQNTSGETKFGSPTEIAAGNYILIKSNGEISRFIANVEYSIFAGPVPHGTMRLDTPADQLFTKTSWDKINFDQKGMEIGGMVVDVATKTITVPKDGWYRVVLGVNAIFPGADNLSVMVYVNDSPYSTNPTNRAGEGNGDEVILNWVSVVQLTAGDVIDLRGQNAPTGSGNLNLHMKRLFFSVEYDI